MSEFALSSLRRGDVVVLDRGDGELTTYLILVSRSMERNDMWYVEWLRIRGGKLFSSWVYSGANETLFTHSGDGCRASFARRGAKDDPGAL